VIGKTNLNREDCVVFDYIYHLFGLTFILIKQCFLFFKKRVRVELFLNGAIGRRFCLIQSLGKDVKRYIRKVYMSISKKELELLQEVSTTYCERSRGSSKVSFTSSESIGFRRI
jgi:hypothetical protein